MISVYFGSGIGLKNLQIQGGSNGHWNRDGLWRQQLWLEILSQLLCHICTNLKELLVEGSNWIGLLIETKN